MKKLLTSLTLSISFIVYSQYVPYITPEQYGARGNGISDDYTALKNAVTYAIRSERPLVLTKTYFISRTLEVGGVTIQSHNATIKGSASLLYLLKAEGSVGSYTNSTANVVSGSTEVTIPNTSSFFNGDLIKITSNKLSDIGEGTKQGEIQQVERYENNKIKTYRSFNDTYTTSDAVRVAKILPTTLIINGKLNLVGGNSTSNIGLLLKYTKDVYIENINISKCRYISLWVDNSYNANINGYYRDADRMGEGYGVTLTGAMYSKFTGSSDYSRHAVSVSGYVDVVSWENTISISATINDKLDSGFTSAIFDSHGSAGSTYWVNCIAIGKKGTDQIGYSLSGRNDYVYNTTATDLKAVITRGRNSLQNNIIINGIIGRNCLEVIKYFGGETKNFSLSNVEVINNTTIPNKYAISFTGSKIREWKIENIKVINIAGFLSIDMLQNDAPNDLRLNNIYTRNNAITSDRFITAAAPTHTSFNNIEIINSDVEHGEIYLGKVTNFKMANSKVNKIQYYLLRNNAPSNNIIFENNYIGESTEFGNIALLQNVNNLILKGNIIESNKLQGVYVQNGYTFLNFMATSNTVNGWYNNSGVTRFINPSSVIPTNTNISTNNLY